jgi:hypothetical protein
VIAGTFKFDFLPLKCLRKLSVEYTIGEKVACKVPCADRVLTVQYLHLDYTPGDYYYYTAKLQYNLHQGPIVLKYEHGDHPTEKKPEYRKQPTAIKPMPVQQPTAIKPMPVQQPTAKMPMPVQQSTAIKPMPGQQSTAIKPMPGQQSTAKMPMPVQQPTAIKPMPVQQSTAIKPMPQMSAATVVPTNKYILYVSAEEDKETHVHELTNEEKPKFWQQQSKKKYLESDGYNEVSKNHHGKNNKMELGLNHKLQPKNEKSNQPPKAYQPQTASNTPSHQPQTASNKLQIASKKLQIASKKLQIASNTLQIASNILSHQQQTANNKPPYQLPTIVPTAQEQRLNKTNNLKMLIPVYQTIDQGLELIIQRDILPNPNSDLTKLVGDALKSCSLAVSQQRSDLQMLIAKYEEIGHTIIPEKVLFSKYAKIILNISLISIDLEKVVLNICLRNSILPDGSKYDISKVQLFAKTLQMIFDRDGFMVATKRYIWSMDVLMLEIFESKL